ncbi:MAG: hypothetical protein RL113_624 [Pseudomonadota bacterium]|jgi:hypothetical protein
MRYTQKQIDKFNRQKYIIELEKISKNLFRMFRDKAISAEQFKAKFMTLKEKFEEREEILLESEYHQMLKAYIFALYEKTCLDEAFGEKVFSDIREAQMSQLNRLQKLKNGTSYKKEKHKSKPQEEDWGHS